MSSLERLSQRRRGTPGAAPLCLALVLVLVLLQGLQVSASLPVLNVHGVWGVPPFCFGMIATLVGFALARHRTETPWRTYATDRILSGPVYVLTILASAFALGPALGSLSLRDYFGSGETYAYLLNLVGIPQFTLPGVFEFNDFVEAVNENVWVAPFYAILVGAAAAIDGPRWLRVALAAGLGLVVVAAILLQALEVPFDDTHGLWSLTMRGDGLTVLAGGGTGIAAFRYRRSLTIDGRLAIVAAMTLAVLIVAGNPNWLGNAVFRIATAIPLSYLALYVALRRLPFAVLAARVNRRYLPGMFLLSFPLQQAAVQLGPRGQGVLTNVLLASGPVAVTAIAFWHLVTVRLPGGNVREAAQQTIVTDAGLRISIWQRVRRIRRVRPSAIGAYAALVAVLALLVLGLLAMVYFALLPDH